MKREEFTAPPQSAWVLKSLNRLAMQGRRQIFGGIPEERQGQVDRRRAKNKVAKQSRKINRRK